MENFGEMIKHKPPQKVSFGAVLPVLVNIEKLSPRMKKRVIRSPVGKRRVRAAGSRKFSENTTFHSGKTFFRSRGA